MPPKIPGTGAVGGAVCNKITTPGTQANTACNVAVRTVTVSYFSIFFVVVPKLCMIMIDVEWYSWWIALFYSCGTR
jgi:hypothetical protein